MFMRSGYSAQTRSSGTQHHHLAARIVLGGRHVRPPAPLEAERNPLALEPSHGQPVKADDVLLDGHVTLEAHDLATSLEHEAAPVRADRRRLARINDPVDLAHVR